jgi:primosomal protein N'
MSYYFEVIPFGQIQESLTYKYSQILPLGCIVQVPLRGKIQGGVVLAQTKENDIQFDLKKILKIKSFYPHCYQQRKFRILPIFISSLFH